MTDPTPRRGGPLSAVEPWNWVADGYVELTMPMLAPYAEVAIGKAQLAAAHRVLDLACGPGTVACRVAPTVSQVVAIDFSEAMVAHCQRRVGELGLTNVTVQQGDGQSLLLPDGSFDRAFSMFGLMFFPDRGAGFRELHRVLVPGGRAYVTSWAPLDESPLMSAMFRALRVADPAMPPPTADVTSLENPAVFQREMESAGFDNVTVERVFCAWEFDDFEALFDRMLRGSAPLELMRRRLPEEEWERRVPIMREALREELGPHPKGLGSTAWLAEATRP